MLVFSGYCCLLSAQKVGINKTNPTEALDVNGYLSGALKVNGVAGTAGGSSINYTIGSGGAYKGAGGNTTVTLPGGTLTALGANAITLSGGNEQYGVNNINPAGSMAAFYMPGNRGTTTRYDFGQKSSTIYTQTTYLASGGAPVGMLNTSINNGNTIYYENGVLIWAVLSPGPPTLPGSGGCYYHNAAAGMVIFWW